MCDLTKRIIMRFVGSHIDAIMRVVSVHIINFKNRIDALHPHHTPTKAKLNARADTRNANLTTNCGSLDRPRITVMCIQCGRMQRAS